VIISSTPGFYAGLTPQTGSLEILRAVLESIAYSMKQLVETMENESDYAHATTIQSVPSHFKRRLHRKMLFYANVLVERPK
jgi:glycerol kinase